ncbi:hypothetical protein [Saccharopolyspora pogona]|uniref:hypothetical protein n=1 Tax=Saccharopolyspora pogona TaxID=333966 RepID=UPI001684CBF9|nr:hypothetical protein [Saccharopolyspora pogona]
MPDRNEVAWLAMLELALITLGCAAASVAPRRHGSVAEHLSDWWVIARGLVSGRRARLRRLLHRGGARRG